MKVRRRPVREKFTVSPVARRYVFAAVAVPLAAAGARKIWEVLQAHRNPGLVVRSGGDAHDTALSGMDPAVNVAKKIAVIAHRKKTLGGGLAELRRLIADERVDHLLWYEVPKSRKAGKKARKAVAKGAKLVFVWGGDGMVQRCADALAGSGATMAIVPAGTANLLADNLGIPDDLAEAVWVGFHGARRTIDLGRLNGEHFAVMAGAGFDGELMREADRDLKDRIGRLAYVWTGLRHVDDKLPRVRIRVDGTTWFDDEASCVLIGNVGTITGGITAFDDAQPDDGWLEVGVSTAQGAAEWARTFGRMVAGRSEGSPFVRMTRARKIRVAFAEATTYELDGGARKPVTKLKARVARGAITICVPPRSG